MTSRLSGAIVAQALTALLALAAGCGPDAVGYPFVRELRAAPDAGADVASADDARRAAPAEPLEPWDESGAGPLTGLFAVAVRVEARLGIPLASHQLLRLRVLQRDRRVRHRLSVCRLLLPSLPGVATLEVPPALEAVLRARGVEREGDSLSSPEPVGADWTSGPEPIVIGARLADPISGPLPTPDDLSAALDEDGDGQPGVTLTASTLMCEAPAELYAALRVVLDLRGHVESPDLVTGEVRASLDQSVLGWSDDCLAAAAGLPIEVVPGSTFRALRVGMDEDLDDNGNVTCDEVVAAAPALLGGVWQEEER